MFLKGNPPANSTGKTKPTRTSSRKDVPSVISSDFNLLGNVVCDSMVDFDGRIDGNIQCHTLVLRKNGRVNGEIIADTVQIYGCVKGMIKAKNVSLFGGCMVEGIVLHQALTIADGAVVDGKLKRLDKAHSATSELLDEGDAEASGGSAANPPRMLDGFKLIAGNNNN